MTLSRFLDPKHDLAFKKIFGSEKNKDILIHFLNDILELKGNNKVTEVQFLSTVQDADIASKKQSIVDVLCKDEHGIQFIVEMQVDPTEGFEKRAQYYAAKAYCRQTNKGKGEDGKYSNLKEIIFIAIADYILFPNKDKKEYISRHVILDKNSYEHDLKDFSFTFIELPKFKKDKIEELSNMTEKWCYFFKYAQDTTLAELDKIIGSDSVIKKAYVVLDQFSWSEEELLAYEQELKRIWDNKAVEEYKINKTKAEIKKAKEEGKEEGKAEGRKEEKFALAKKMLVKNRPLDEIMEFTGLTNKEVKSINIKTD
jgi:predicted transposase/invertase (TIGR01784 family)